MIVMLEEEAMQQSSQSSYNEFLIALNQNTRQLEKLGEQFDRLNERSRDFATRSDLETLRKDLVARDALDPQLNDLRAQIKRVNDDRVEDRKDWEERAKELETEQLSRQDRLYVRIGQILSAAAFLLALFEFLSHLKFIP